MQPFYVLVSGEAVVLHLVETLARLVSGLFKNILRDLERGPGTVTSFNAKCLRLSLIPACVRGDLRSLIYLSLTRCVISCAVSSCYSNAIYLTAISKDEVIVTSIWKPSLNSNVLAQLI